MRTSATPFANGRRRLSATTPLHPYRFTASPSETLLRSTPTQRNPRLTRNPSTLPGPQPISRTRLRESRLSIKSTKAGETTERMAIPASGKTQSKGRSAQNVVRSVDVIAPLDCRFVAGFHLFGQMVPAELLRHGTATFLQAVAESRIVNHLVQRRRKWLLLRRHY